MHAKLLGLLAASLVLLAGCQGSSSTGTRDNTVVNPTSASMSPMIPAELEYIPDGYAAPSAQPGTLEQISYSTFESFSYDAKTTPLTKTAWVYLPHGYTAGRRYNVFYLSHGGWSNETTLMGTPDAPHPFKHIVDNAIADGRIKPLIIVLPTYNNTSPQDSSDYGLALRLTDNFHRELVNDLMPAVESTWSTYAEDTTPEGLRASRDHRGFGGFSMGSVNTWHTFEHSLDYFRYFMPMSGALTSDGELLASVVRNSNHKPGDFFIYAMSGTGDFANDGMTSQVEAMARVDDATFVMADTEDQGNLAYRVRTGNGHDASAANEYTYNGLRFFWADGDDGAAALDPTGGVAAQDAFEQNSTVVSVIADEVFAGYGRLLFPVGQPIDGDLTLREAGSLFPWYTQINPDRTVDVVNSLYRHAAAGEQIFYDIYTTEEKQQDPAKYETGLFFFRGDRDARVAIINAGGGFAYVGAMHDSFPHALELSRLGYNAFALIYRPGPQTGAEDLARAIAFIHDNADELEVDTSGYSLWGGSAGARLAAWLGSDGTAAYGEDSYPRPAAVIMQYTGLDEITGNEPPTYACVGTNDSIANADTMQRRIAAIRANGTDAQIEVFDGLGHGFGLGEGTVAEGWLERAVEFWQRHAAEGGITG